MNDAYGRRLHYLRVSVTDRCNLRCRYCMPESGVVSFSHEDILSYDEIVRVVRILANLGVDRVRLTGGEPLVRKGVQYLAADIKAIPNIRFLGLTTNGVYLPEMASKLAAADVDGVNISIDTLDRKRYEEITRRDALPQALDGLSAALKAPFSSVKVNCVLFPRSLPEDWLSVISLAKKYPVDVRLIEWMPMTGESIEDAVTADEAFEIIEKVYGVLQPARQNVGAGPARYWQVSDFKGRIGIIQAMSHNFCNECNRLRLTATGDLKLCLFYDIGIALKPMLRGGASDEQLAEAILEAIKHKPRQHAGKPMVLEEGGICSVIEPTSGMHKIGG